MPKPAYSIANSRFYSISARPETLFCSAKWQDGRYAALAVRLINQ